MNQLIRDNASALIGVSGVVIGAFITFLASWALRKRDYDLRLWDKLIDRRIDAHERLINHAHEMRVMTARNGVDEDGEVLRYPQVLSSRDAFEDWFANTIRSIGFASTWLSTPAKREANFLQDYLVTLHINLRSVPSDRFPDVGLIVRQDFIDMSSNLERMSFVFFDRDVRKLRLSNLNDWHKYPRQQTEKRLNETNLLRQWADVSRLAESKADEGES
jgi:hypothetical protein